MTPSKNILPDKRRTAVLVTLLILLALFMLPYFFIFIPSNAENLKRQAFLKLNRAAQNIIDKTRDTRSFYMNTKTATEMIHAADMRTSECNSNIRERISFLDNMYFQYVGTPGWNILFIQSKKINIAKKDTLTEIHSLPLESYIGPCIASGKEVFTSFLLIHYCQFIGRDTSGQIIYQDFGQGMEQNINLDSLIPRQKGLRTPDIQDITLKGTDYKLFTYPFQLGRHRLILCGLLKTDTYNTQIHQIPVGKLYTVIICLTLFLLSLPFLKIFIMNARDRIYASNLVTGVVFLFVMASFITIIITQLILFWQGRSQVNKNLTSLSRTIEDSLSGELRQAQDELAFFDGRLDSFLHNPDSSGQADPATDLPCFLVTKDSMIRDDAFNNKKRVLFGHAPLYHNADHCSWVSDTGQESVRMRYIDSETVIRMRSIKNPDSIRFVNAKTRAYYVEMWKNWKYRKDTASTIMLAPVQSWASGEFRVNIIRYSIVKKYLFQVLSTRLYSLVNTVMPGGYGYCLIDDKGNVMIHSDSLKSLKENFLDETGDLPWILGSIKGRQEALATDVSVYGGSYAVHIQPLHQHPYFLAVFYNNDYLEPPNLRVLTFTIFFCLLTFGLFFLLFKAFYTPPHRTSLFSPMDYYGRLIPLKEKLPLYFKGSLFLIFYILLFGIASILCPVIGYDFDFTMLVIGLLSPFTILYSIRLLHDQTVNSKNKKYFLFTNPILIAGILIYILSRVTHLHLEPVGFGIMETLLIFLLYFIVLKNGKIQSFFYNAASILMKLLYSWKRKTPEQKKVNAYSTFVALFIFAIAILPPLEYSWFAYNHELKQSIKREQLEIAVGLQKRERTIHAFLRTYQPDFSGDDKFYDTIQYQRGIYPVSCGTVVYFKDSSLKQGKNEHGFHSELFYLSVANNINFLYKDPSGLPPLNDNSKDDNLWHWNQQRDTCEFDYAKAKWQIPPESDSVEPKIIFKIFSKIPTGLRINSQLQIVFAGLILLLGLAVFRIIKSIARQVYLTKIIADSNPGLKNTFGEDKTEFWNKCLHDNATQPGIAGKWTSAPDLINQLSDEYNIFSKTTPDKIAYYESAFTSRSGELKSVFECIWKKLDDNEKYLLYCLANDGLINHKNESLIFGLLHKNLLVIHDQRIRLISYSFRNFVISRNNTKGEKILLSKMQAEASWNYLRTIVVVVVISVFIFLFLTQQEVSAKIIALFTGLSALLPLVLRFGSSGAAASDKK